MIKEGYTERFSLATVALCGLPWHYYPTQYSYGHL